jgi:hypothetical protein
MSTPVPLPSHDRSYSKAGLAPTAQVTRGRAPSLADGGGAAPLPPGAKFQSFVQSSSIVPRRRCRGSPSSRFSRAWRNPVIVRRARPRAPRDASVRRARPRGRVSEYVGHLYGLIGHSVGGAARVRHAPRPAPTAWRWSLRPQSTTRLRPVSPGSSVYGTTSTGRYSRACRAPLTSVRIQDLDVRSDAERIATPLLVVTTSTTASIALRKDGAAIAHLARRPSVQRTR